MSPCLPSSGKDSEDPATLCVTLASRIVYRVMSLHTGASEPPPFSLSLDPSPSVPFHSILPRSRHCSVVPFIRNKVSSGPAQCTPVFLGSLYLFPSPPGSPRHPFREIFVLSSLLLLQRRKIALRIADRSFRARQTMHLINDVPVGCNVLHMVATGGDSIHPLRGLVYSASIDRKSVV